jgi:putative ABC transport system permease protein
MKSVAGLAWKNIVRRPWRNAILTACMASLVGLLVAATLIEAASTKGLRLGIDRLGADLVAVPRNLDSRLIQSYMTGEAAIFYMAADIEKKIRDFPFVEKTSPQLYIKSLTGAACCSSWNVFLIGFDQNTDFTIKPWLNKHQDRPLGENDILVGAGVQSFSGMAIKFYGHEFRVAGTLDPGGMGLDTSIFIPIEAARRMIAESKIKAKKPLDIQNNQISAVLIKLKNASDGGLPGWKASYELQNALPEISIIEPADITLRTQKNLAGTLKTIYAASYAVWPMTALLIGLVFFMAVKERQRELGLLRAMGATRLDIFKMIHIEALIVSAAGALAGIIISAGLVVLFQRMISMTLEVPFSFPSSYELMIIAASATGLAIITGAVAAMLPAAMSCMMEPYEAIRKGE